MTTTKPSYFPDSAATTVTWVCIVICTHLFVAKLINYIG